jgi:hypothetical protein
MAVQRAITIGLILRLMYESSPTARLEKDPDLRVRALLKFDPDHLILEKDRVQLLGKKKVQRLKSFWQYQYFSVLVLYAGRLSLGRGS